MKVAIIGPAADQNACLAYLHGYEVWGINSSYRQQHPAAKWTRMFNLHRYAHLKRDCPQYIEWDSDFSRSPVAAPVYTIDHWHGRLLTEVIFPRAHLARQPRTHYHASSFDWLVAYAVYLKAKEIHLHGAKFALDSPREEPMSAQACLEYWCGYATGLGIKVMPGRDCEIFTQYHLVASHSVYGYDDVHMVEDRR